MQIFAIHALPVTPPLPKGWPVLLEEAVQPGGDFTRTFLTRKNKSDGGNSSEVPKEQPQPVAKSPPQGTTSDAKFSVGDVVNVDTYGVGVIKFVGVHHVSGSPRIGVALNEAIGNNDGTVKGHRYFECLPKHGVLTKPEKCKKVDNATSDVLTIKPSEDEAHLAGPPSATGQEEVPPAAPPRTSAPPDDKTPPQSNNDDNHRESTAINIATTDVKFERADSSESFGFGLAEMYAGYEKKWVTVVSNAPADGRLEIGQEVLAIECTLDDNSTVKIDLSGSEVHSHEDAITALRRAGKLVILTVASHNPTASFSNKSVKQNKILCGMTVWCKCPKCSAAIMLPSIADTYCKPAETSSA